jgi:hypothetical protein
MSEQNVQMESGPGVDVESDEVQPDFSKVKFFEATYDAHLPPYIVRVWRSAPSYDEAVKTDFSDVNAILEQCVFGHAVLLAELTKLPNVTAVQVVSDGNNLGVVAYTEWP